jgi:hypothetical protein
VATGRVVLLSIHSDRISSDLAHVLRDVGKGNISLDDLLGAAAGGDHDANARIQWSP